MNNLILRFTNKWLINKTMMFEDEYPKSLQLSLRAKRKLLVESETAWLYNAINNELIGETYGMPTEVMNSDWEDGWNDIEPYVQSGNAFYIYSTTILQKYQGKGFGKILKAYFLGQLSRHVWNPIIGHAREGASVELNKLFGAEIGAAHPNWYGSGETYYFYTLRL